jgi:hypothetical protein
MDGKLRSVNLQLIWALTRPGVSYICITDSVSVLNSKYIAHGQHLNF